MVVQNEDWRGVLDALHNISKIASYGLATSAAMERNVAVPDAETVDPVALLGRARRCYEQRRRRDRAFGEHADVFSDPAWDIMLDLYICGRQHAQISVSSACLASCVPATTGLRWIALLERRHLVKRRPDPFDKRRTFVHLTTEGEELMAAALAQL